MGNMRAATFTEPKSAFGDDPWLQLETIPRPTCQTESDVVIRVLAAGVCQTDLFLIGGGDVAGVRPHEGMVLGHETAGLVVEVGENVTMVESGDFVLCYPFLPIGDQVVPTSAAPVGGQDRRTLGISQNGGFAEFVLTDERSLVKVKNEQECRELVALTDAGLAAYKSVSRAALHRHIDGGVAVLGLGGLGHLGIQMLRALGIAPVWGVDPRAETREWAVGRGFSDIFTTGAELQAHLATGEHPCEVVIDFVGSDETAQLALNVLSFGGLYECVGVGGSFTLSTQDLVEREITLQGALVGSMSDLENAISLFQQSDCEVATTQFRLDDIDNALRSLRNGTINGRIIIIP